MHFQNDEPSRDTIPWHHHQLGRFISSLWLLRRRYFFDQPPYHNTVTRLSIHKPESRFLPTAITGCPQWQR